MKFFLTGLMILITTSLLLSFRNMSADGFANSREKASPVVKMTMPPTICIGCTTLNNVDYATAVQNINNFQALKGKDNSTGKEASIWFSSAQIDSINNLLTIESAASVPVEKRLDGIRFYLGTNTSGSTKLNLSIYMVSTRQRLASDPQVCGGTPITCSPHIDYYNHNGYFTQPGGFGDTRNSVNSSTDIWGKNDLYSVPIPGNACQNEPDNYIDNDTAHGWIVDRYSKTDTINSNSEWFQLCFIQYLFNTIHKYSSSLGGLRIYLAKGNNIRYPGAPRDLFLLVPTDNTGADYYGCLDDLTSLPVNCIVNNDTSVSNQKLLLKLRERKIKLKAIPKILENAKRYEFLFSAGGNGSGGAYDNGELCPFNCN